MLLLPAALRVPVQVSKRRHVGKFNRRPSAVTQQPCRRSGGMVAATSPPARVDTCVPGRLGGKQRCACSKLRKRVLERLRPGCLPWAARLAGQAAPAGGSCWTGRRRWRACARAAKTLPDTPSSLAQVKRVFCESSGALVPKDKAVKRFIVRNIVESAAIRDLQESCVYECACSRPTARRLPSLLQPLWRPWLEYAGRGGVVSWPSTAPAAPLAGLPGTTLVHNPGADLCPRALPPHSLRAAQAVPQGLLLHLRGHPLEGVPPAPSVFLPP